MIRITFVLGFATVVLGATIPQRHNYIVGGKPTKIENVPYQIALLSKKMELICGGVILSETHAITAAHCLDTQDIKQYSIRSGSSDKTKGGQVVTLKKITTYPKFNIKTMDYDIAVLELSTPLKFTNSTKAIQLIEKETPDGEILKVSGWGCTKENGTRPDLLQSVAVAMVSRMTCEKSYDKKYKITSRMICAAGTRKDACDGDDGGPLTYKGVLVGLVSFGIGCAREDYPRVYTNIADREIRKFIKDNTGV